MYVHLHPMKRSLPHHE